ncbi:winged helix-turn-helix domain-containing protein [Nonomuraea sp. NPDC046570]|uniref:ArsR/SmtB family transcription factor n=1 Tax=Nonomuraea sp. NPDC046570 TaxID=3155255 RepID=UPI0033FC41B5
MTQQNRPPLSDPKAMRALAHSARLEILNRLGADGPATATEVAEIVGITPSAASYHLRMLAKYGFVEDAPARGDGRERLWRAVEGGLSVQQEPDDTPDVRAAKELLIGTFYDDAHEELKRSMAAINGESREWREAAHWQRATLLLDAAEMGRLVEQISQLVDPFRAAARDRSQVPEGARLSQSIVSVFPIAERRTPGLPTEDHGRA